MITRVSNPHGIAQERVGVYLPNQSWRAVPSFSVSRERARRLRDEGQADFINKGRAIQLKTFRVPNARSKQLGSCRTCGGGSFHTICPRCRLDEIVFGRE
jgi:hypothetical protein